MAEREIRCTDVTGCVLDQPIHQDALNLDSGELIGRGGFLPLTESATPVPLTKKNKKPKAQKPTKTNKTVGKGKAKPSSSSASSKKAAKKSPPKAKPNKPSSKKPQKKSKK